MKYPGLILLIYFTLPGAIMAATFESDSSETSHIDFISFSAILSDRIIHFSWDIDSETRGDRFEIEKSLDREEWMLVTSVESIESHKERHTYKVSDINFPEAPNEFFRIVRVDVDGVRTILDEVDIRQPVLSDAWLLHVKGKFNKLVQVSFESLICSEGELRLSNASGVLVSVKRLQVNTGNNRTELVIKNLPEGSYTLMIRDEFGNSIERLLTIRRNVHNPRTKF